MNEKFLELPKEKQLRIINGCMEVFSKNEYKRASTDEMAAKADISKGLLFYYFHNKKSLYMFLFQYAEDELKKKIVDDNFYRITDFFELLEYAGGVKMEILQETPYITDFVMNAFFSQKEDVSEALDHRIESVYSEMMMEYFKNIDYSKFKEDVSPNEIMLMLTWMADGYLHEKRRNKETVNLEILIDEFHKWCQMFRKICYKEEFLHGIDSH